MSHVDAIANLIEANQACVTRKHLVEGALSEALHLLFMLEDKAKTTEECYIAWKLFKAKHEELILEMMPGDE